MCLVTSLNGQSFKLTYRYCSLYYRGDDTDHYIIEAAGKLSLTWGSYGGVVVVVEVTVVRRLQGGVTTPAFSFLLVPEKSMCGDN
jgi:hypothetical protein